MQENTNQENRRLRKPPSVPNRPRNAKRILEVGAGQLPYEGVTHVVDKFPDSDEQRGEPLWIPQGVTFVQGELGKLPFPDRDFFDYFYARHVFEHVPDPEMSVREINRVASHGYIETPSPFYEMICCSFPYNPNEMHLLFVWSDQENNALHVIRKSERTIQDFCNCAEGQLVRKLTEIRRREPNRLPDSFLTQTSKTTVLYFSGPINLLIHDNFQEPCSLGVCAFQSVNSAINWARFGWLFRRQSLEFRKLLKKERII